MTEPPVVEALSSKVVPSVIEDTVAFAGIPVPVTGIPAIRRAVLSIVIVGSLL